LSSPTDNQIYEVPSNQFSPSPGTTLRNYAGKQKRNQSPTYTIPHKPARRRLAQEAMCVVRAVANAAQEAEEEEEKEREQTQTAAPLEMKDKEWEWEGKEINISLSMSSLKNQGPPTIQQC